MGRLEEKLARAQEKRDRLINRERERMDQQIRPKTAVAVSPP